METTDSESSCSGNRILPVTPKNVISLPTSIAKSHCHKSNKITTNTKLRINDVSSVECNENCLPEEKCFIDKIFENYDDVHVPFVKSDKKSENGSCQYTYSAIEDTPSTPVSSEQYITEEIKTKRMLATIEGRKDFCEILEHAGINSNTYLAGVFSSKKKICVGFESSTPLISRNSNLRTETPFSGIKYLNSPLNTSNNSSFFSTTISKITYTPQFRIPTDNLENILLGITCYVDVRTGKENYSETCKRELLLIGAKIEKNFTKKVTHVIFKEGKMSTYMRAKKNSIPIVSVTWIEACKVARGLVDPKLYPPAKLEKYENDSPFTLMMKRKFSRLRRKHGISIEDRKTESLNFPSSEIKNKRRKAVTEIKENKVPLEIHNKGKNCTKKLNFNNIDFPEASGVLNNDNLEENTKYKFHDLSDSSIFVEHKIKKLPKKQNGNLKKKKYKKIDYYFASQYRCEQNKDNSTEKSVGRKSSNQEFEEINLDEPIQISDPTAKTCNQIDNFSQGKKRKLFDPTQSFLLSSDTPALTINVSYPYEDTPVSKKRKLNNINKNSLLERLNLSTNQDHDENVEQSSKSGNSSIFLKNDVKLVNSKPKHLPTIVFTSIPGSECDKLVNIVKMLGHFEVEDRVSDRTTHVVTNSMRRTLNLLRGLARGCWLVASDWILKSETSSKWLSEEFFELRSFSPAVTECRLQKKAFKNSFKMDLFSSCGAIYVAQNTSPSTEDLIDLIKLCSGRATSCSRGAKIIVGGKSRSSKTIPRVREKWVLDSISNNALQDLSKYLLQ